MDLDIELSAKQGAAFDLLQDKITRYILFGGAGGGGKALDLNTPIPTPDGWKKISDIMTGDVVFGSDGVPCNVVATSEIMTQRDVFRVWFDDGSYIDCDGQHQWNTYTERELERSVRLTDEFREKRRISRPSRSKGKRPDVAEKNRNKRWDVLQSQSPTPKSTVDIKETVVVRRNGLNHMIAVQGPLSLPEIKYSVHPYVLGVWLGDGTGVNSQITSNDPEILGRIRSLGYLVTKHVSKYSYWVSMLMPKLNEMGLKKNKHIPQIYLRGSIEQRKELLRGLMDTDGSCLKNGKCQFYNTNKRLIHGVAELLSSLGIKYFITNKIAKFNGKEFNDTFTVTFYPDFSPFTLKRKSERVKSKYSPRNKRIYIKSVERIDSVPVRCIQVDSDDNTYLCGDRMIPTHNSWLGVVWLMVMCYQYPETRWFIGREELKRLRESTLLTFFKAAQVYKLPKSDFNYNGQDHFIQFKNGSRIDLLDLKYLPSDPLYERYGSVEYTGGFIDEGGEVHFGAFDVLKTRVGRYNNEKYGLIPAKILITSNPKKNWLYKTFYTPYKAGTLSPEYAFIPALPTENPFLDDGYIANLDAITDKVTKERLKYGNWEYEDVSECLISYDRITDLFTNIHVPAGAKYITSDIARFGKDKTTIALWSGYRCEQVQTVTKSSITETAHIIRALAAGNNIPMSSVVVDEDGVGGGVKDILDCKGFINNSKPIEIKGKPCNYANLKSQCGFMFSEVANAAGVYVNAPGESVKAEIIEELEQLKNGGIDKDQKLSLMAKDKVKDLIGRSPDYSDMLIMRMYFDLPHTTVIRAWSIS